MRADSQQAGPAEEQGWGSWAYEGLVGVFGLNASGQQSSVRPPESQIDALPVLNRQIGEHLGNLHARIRAGAGEQPSYLQAAEEYFLEHGTQIPALLAQRIRELGLTPDRAMDVKHAGNLEALGKAIAAASLGVEPDALPRQTAQAFETRANELAGTPAAQPRVEPPAPPRADRVFGSMGGGF